MNGTGIMGLALLENLPFPVFFRESSPSVAGIWEAANPCARQLEQAWNKLDSSPLPIETMLADGLSLPCEGGELLVPGLCPESMRKGDQMQSFGRLTGGIVHNLNNPLNALSGMIQLMMFRNMDLPELERLDHQTDELAKQIRQLGDRFRRLLEYERGAPLTWELVISEELRFFRADSALKHRCELTMDLPADRPCILPYREASWLVDRMLEAVLLLVPHDDMSELKVDLQGGLPRVHLKRPDLGRMAQARIILTQPLMLDLLAAARYRLDSHASAEEAWIAILPLENRGLHGQE